MSKRIVVVGGKDHGKTTLIEAICKVCGTPVRKLGISMEAHLNIDGEEYIFFDYPETEDYQENLKSFDGIVLCVSATDGPMGGARQQMFHCEEIGMSMIVLFINKTDLVDDRDTLDLVTMESQEFIDEHGVFSDDCPVIHGSASLAWEEPKGEWAWSVLKLVNTVAEVF